MSSTYNIAIDGPAGAGKSTIAKLVAAKTGIYLCGYRSHVPGDGTLLFREWHPAGGRRQECLLACGQIDISLRYQDGVQQVILNGRDVSGKIRTEAVGNAASVVSAYRAVRQALLALQQNLAKTSNVIMDGRDIGTCVLPNAQTKIYLTASSHVRAVRRYKELTEKGQMCNLEEIEQDIIDRDYRDMHREIAPLTQAADAVLLDSSEMTIDQVVDGIIGAARERGLA